MVSSSIDMKDVINIASDYKEALIDLKIIGEVEDIQNDAGLTITIEYCFMLDLL